MFLQDISSSELHVKTAHYEFQAHIREHHDAYTVSIGNEDASCLEVYIRNPEKIDERIRDIANIAVLNKLESLLECSLKDIRENYLETYSMGTELLEFVNTILKERFPHVQHVQIQDKSNVYCSRVVVDRLDLLTYSIAVNTKTWYEMKLGAYILPKHKYETYRKQVKQYASESYIQCEAFFDLVHSSSNSFAKDILFRQKEILTNLYNNSKTFPDFFSCLGKIVHRNEKCKFFKSWLEEFVQSSVNIRRVWQYDIVRPVCGARTYKRRYKN